MNRALRLALAPLLPLTLLSAGCLGGIQLQVLSSAPVTVPASVKKVVVVDRSAPRNAGQGFLDALEGALTGEDIRADREAAEATVQSLEQALMNSPRFEVVRVQLSRRDLGSSPDDRAADWPLIDRICRQAGCDGVVALELFDSNTGPIQFPTPNPNSTTTTPATVKAVRDAQVTVSIRFYDARQHQIVDEVIRRRIDQPITQEAATNQEVRNRLNDVRGHLAKLGRQVGHEYGKRVAPAYQWVSRSYYINGHPSLKQAKRHVRANDWPGAVRLWAQLAEEAGDPKLKGKARFNLALASERTGDLDHAVHLAKQAAVELGNSRARRYRHDLERRRADAARLDAQMDNARPAPAAPPRPATPQPVQPTQPAGRGPL